MIPLQAAQVAHAVAGELVDCPPQTLINGPVVTDSRLAEPGSLFVAVAGERTDGHDHTRDAQQRGARLVLATRPVEGPHVLVADTVQALGELARSVLAELRRHAGVQVVGITGSVGKTTTKDLLGQVLSHSGQTVAPQASFNNEIGLPLTVLRASTATRFLILEMGASGIGHIEYLTRIAPLDVAVVLYVGRAHLAGFGSLDTVARAKSEIVAGLRSEGTAVLNIDDAHVAAMAARAPGGVISFGYDPAARVHASEVTLDSHARATFRLRSDVGGIERTAPAHLALSGQHQVHNALAVVAACQALGLELTAVVAALSGAEPISAHRMALHHRADGVTVLDDSYNANPDSVGAALRSLAALPAQRRIAVLGEMLELGPGSDEQHEAVGRLAAELGLDLVLAPGELGARVAAGAERVGGQAQQLADIVATGTQLRSMLREGDVVLLKGSQASGMWQLAEQLLAAEEEVP